MRQCACPAPMSPSPARTHLCHRDVLLTRSQAQCRGRAGRGDSRHPVDGDCGATKHLVLIFGATCRSEGADGYPARPPEHLPKIRHLICLDPQGPHPALSAPDTAAIVMLYVFHQQINTPAAFGRQLLIFCKCPCLFRKVFVVCAALGQRKHKQEAGSRCARCCTNTKRRGDSRPKELTKLVTPTAHTARLSLPRPPGTGSFSSRQSG